MDADGAFRATRLEHVHRFLRADLVAAHQLARAEGTDCDRRQPWPPPLGGFRHPASIAPPGVAGEERSEERRVGKECVSPWRARWAPVRHKEKTMGTAVQLK